MLLSLKWFGMFLSSVGMLALGMHRRFTSTTGVVKRWQSNDEDLTPHGVYSAASVCDDYGICLTCDVRPVTRLAGASAQRESAVPALSLRADEA